jgi:hypothetical protein
MSRFGWLVLAFIVCAAATAAAQHEHGKPGTSKLTDQQKIASAMAAAPASVSKAATIMDWPEKEGQPMRQLRAGTNNWVCFPSTPIQSTHGALEDPMCLDKSWQSWAEAWMTKTAPKSPGTGIAYMLAGDKGASNTDPFAIAPTADNQWVRTGPHVMVLTADTALLDAFPTDPDTGGPYVMWKGTPYAHLMVPVGPGTHTMKMGQMTPAKPAPKP